MLGVLAAIIARTMLASRAVAQETILDEEPPPSSVEQEITPMERSFRLLPERPVLVLPRLKEQLKDAPPFFRDTKIDVDLRTYYLNQKKFDDNHAEALAGGGALRHVAASRGAARLRRSRPALCPREALRGAVPEPLSPDLRHALHEPERQPHDAQHVRGIQPSGNPRRQGRRTGAQVWGRRSTSGLFRTTSGCCSRRSTRTSAAWVATSSRATASAPTSSASRPRRATREPSSRSPIRESAAAPISKSRGAATQATPAPWCRASIARVSRRSWPTRRTVREARAHDPGRSVDRHYDFPSSEPGPRRPPVRRTSDGRRAPQGI